MPVVDKLESTYCSSSTAIVNDRRGSGTKDDAGEAPFCAIDPRARQTGSGMRAPHLSRVLWLVRLSVDFGVEILMIYKFASEQGS